MSRHSQLRSEGVDVSPSHPEHTRMPQATCMTVHVPVHGKHTKFNNPALATN